jgi:hypothetical protein
MKISTEHTLAKVPEVTLGFWIIKIAATTLGETGGDAVSMSMNLGYLVGTGIFAAIFLAAVIAQVKANDFHPILYWATIISTTTVGTTLADSADRSLGIGYAGGSSVLLALLLGSLFVWHRTLGSVSVSTVSSPKAEAFYWLTIMFSQTLGTALGDWTADTAGLGYRRGRRVRRTARSGRGGLLLDECVPHAAVLGGLHFDAPAGCRGRGLSGQAAERRRSGTESLFGIGRVAGLHADRDPVLQAASSQDSTLNNDGMEGKCGYCWLKTIP